jgi:uncharacterized protein (DUF1778 family)
MDDNVRIIKIRIPEYDYNRAKSAAELDERSANSFMVRAIRAAADKVLNEQ